MTPRVVMLALVFTAIALVGIGVTLWNGRPRAPLPLAAVTEFAGVRLGETPSEVALVLGPPNAMTEPATENGLARFDYVYSGRKLEVVFYGANKDGAKAAMVCSSEPTTTLLGLDSSSNEQSIIHQLGSPDSVSVARDGVSKIVSFKKWKAAFVFEHGAVSQKCATASGSMGFNERLPGPEKKIPHFRPTVAPNQTPSASEALGPVAVEGGARPDAEPAAPAQDATAGEEICAPNLSKEERLGRLASFGTVRQSGEETYEAGAHKVQFVLGGLVDCY